MADDAAYADEGSETETSLLEKLKSWFVQDRDARIEWAKEAELDYGWSAPGGTAQWEDADRDRMKAQNKPCITFNRILPVIQSVCGMEINDRKELKFLPRTTQNEPRPQVDPATGQPALGQPAVPGADDTGPAETLSAAADYLRDQCDAEDEESDAFQDTVTCGVGCVDTRVDYETNPDGDLREDRVDPLEAIWDCKATKRNLIDARRVWRVREIDKEDAKNEFDETDLSKLDASWARLEGPKQPHDREAARNYPDQVTDQNRKTVTLVECQWWEMKPAWKAANPQTGEVMDVEKGQIKRLKANAAAADIPIKISKHNKKVFYTATIGGEILEKKESQSQECFSLQFITGYRDRNAKQWVGLVRAMRDPQRWANALFSSVLHQIMTSGKGLIAEKDAFDDWQKAERDWANASKIVQAKVGALGQHPKVKQKEQNNIPPGTFDLMTFALGAFRDVTGVNVEAMGLADRQQAASLELQRRQAATTILAPFFDGMRRYRKDNGRLILDLIVNYLSDGRLVRVVGPDYEKYVPLIKSDETLEYDIIIDESASSPNQKQASWEILQGILPVIGKNLTGSSTAILMKASPLPLSIVNEFKESAEKDAQSAPPPPEMIQAQMAQEQHQFDMQAQAQKGEMEGAKMQMEMQSKQIDLQIEMQKLEQAKLKTLADLQTAQLNMQGAAEQRGHDAAMHDKEMAGQMMERQETKTQGDQMMNGVADGQRAIAQALESLAKALSNPKTAKLSPDGMTATIQ